MATNLFTCKEAKYNLVVYLNAIAVDPRNPGLLAVAGMDEYARVYDIRSYRSETWYNYSEPVDHFCPAHLIGSDHVGITGLAYSDQSELLASYTDEFIYLFSPGMGMGPNPPSSSETDTETETQTEVRKTIQPQVYKEHSNRETVKGVGFFGPKCEYVVSGSDCGRIFIWRKKDGELLRAMEADKHVVNCIESHPHMPLMASSGIETDIKIWTPGGTEELGSPRTAEQVMELYSLICHGMNTVLEDKLIVCMLRPGNRPRFLVTLVGSCFMMKRGMIMHAGIMWPIVMMRTRRMKMKMILMMRVQMMMRVQKRRGIVMSTLRLGRIMMMMMRTKDDHLYGLQYIEIH